MHFSRTCGVLFFIANLTAFIGSIPILGMGWLMMTNDHSQCDRHMYPQLLEIGSFLMISSMLGMIGLCYRIKNLLWIYLVVVVIRIVVHFALTTAAIVSVHDQQALKHDYSGEEYKIEHFSGRVARDYVEGLQWEVRRSCIIKYNSCRGFDHFRTTLSPKDFMQQHPVAWGCCQPPQSCGFRYEGGMTWEVPQTGIQSNNTDCYKYMNNKDVLCTNCDTCKAGFLASLYGDWHRLVSTSSVILGLFLFMIIADLIAIRDIRRNEESRASKF